MNLRKIESQLSITSKRKIVLQEKANVRVVMAFKIVAIYLNFLKVTITNGSIFLWKSGVFFNRFCAVSCFGLKPFVFLVYEKISVLPNTTSSTNNPSNPSNRNRIPCLTIFQTSAIITARSGGEVGVGGSWFSLRWRSTTSQTQCCWRCLQKMGRLFITKWTVSDVAFVLR